MSNYGWTNADGEPIMSGEAYRFEQALDEQDAYERQAFDEDFYADYPDECGGCGADDPDDCTCDEDDDEPFVMEDQWLDGSYEE